MNRGEAPVEAGRVRLDSEGVPSIPTDVQVAQEAPPPEPPPSPPESESDGLDDVAKQLTGDEVKDARQREEDDKFQEDYKALDLMRLVTQGFVTHNVKIFDGFEIQVRTLTEDEDQEILKNMQELTGSNWYVSDMSSRYTLSFVITMVNGVEFGKDREDRYKKIGKWGKPVKLLVLRAFRDLNKAVAMKVKGHSGNWLEHLLIGHDWT